MHRQDLQTNSGTTDSETFNKIDVNATEIPGPIKNKRFPERLSKDHIKTLPVRAFDGKIHLITDIRDVSYAIKTLRKYAVLGFDTETRPVFRKGVQHNVSLLQLSTLKAVSYTHLTLPTILRV